MTVDEVVLVYLQNVCEETQKRQENVIMDVLHIPSGDREEV
jgi:hypothetical protein